MIWDGNNKMIADRMIDKYLDEAVKSVPLGARRQVRTGLNEMIREMLDQYCEGERPTLRDTRSVLRAIGAPETAAGQFIEEKKLTRKQISRRNIKYIKRAMEFVFAIAVLLMMTGLLSVIIGRAGNIKAFIAGALLAVGIMLVRNFMPMPDEDLYSDSSLVDSK